MSSSTAEKLLLELQNQYLANLPLQIDDVEQLCLQVEKRNQNEDYQELLRKIHSMKGAGGTYGYHVLSTICHQLEDYLSILDPENQRIQPKHTDIMMQYVDLLRETQNQLLNSTLEQQRIEIALQAIKKQSHQAQHSVLVIDPAQSVSAIYQKALDKNNVIISTEKDALTALNRLMIEKFDLIITAREFSHMTSDALIAALRLSNNPNTGIPVILASSSGELTSTETIASPDIIIKKSPTLPVEISAAVSKYLN